ncbi:transmembrane protein 163 [Plakobranchus ocellatus]|uniref:Transmembrane protein 163 n=1 Tax=Plakobranchus ocellatus TaxID=259542 RepID=A0AAV4APG4_9GAST|nr:transmembrane protein 163 [Plakobranchus ocellatus]
MNEKQKFAHFTTSEMTTVEDSGECSHEDDREGIPTDQGWSWVICFSVFAIVLLQFGHDQVIFVLFVDIVEEFQQPASVMTSMFTIFSVTSALSSVVTSNLLMPRFSTRQITCAIGVFGSTLTLALSRSPNVVWVMVLFGMRGLCFGGLLVCPTSLLGYYFVKRRAFATAVSNTGLCAAFIIFPGLTQLLREEYGLRGTLLIVAAIELHIVALGLLLRPVESYRKLYRIQVRRRLLEARDVQELAPLTYVAGDAAGDATGECPAEKDQSNVPEASMNTKPVLSDLDAHNGIADSCGTEKPASYHIHLIRKETSSEHHSAERDTPITPTFEPKVMPVSSCCGDCPDVEDIEDKILMGLKSCCMYRRQPHRKRSCGAPACDCLVAESQELQQVDALDQREGFDSSSCSRSSSISSNIESENSCFDLSLLKIWPFRLVLLANGLATFTSYLNIYMPTVAVGAGLTRGQAASLPPVVGALDLVSRVIIGYLADTNIIAKTKMVAACLACISVACHLSRFYSTYTHFLLYAACVGLTAGCRHNLLNVILIDHVGVDRLAKGLGLCSLFNTSLLAANHLTIGALVSATGSFVVPLHLVGSVVIIASLLYLCEPLFVRLERSRIAKLKEDQNVSC